MIAACSTFGQEEFRGAQRKRFRYPGAAIHGVGRRKIDRYRRIADGPVE